MRRIILCVCVGFLSLLAASTALGQKKVTLGFDGLPDLSLDVNDFGVDFTGAQVLACGGSLNCGPFPPFSGANVVFDIPGFGGVITAVFDARVTGSVKKVSARVTGNTNVTMTAFGAQGQTLGSAQTGGANFVGSNTGIPANKLLEITSATDSIVRVTFRDSGNTYTIDDFSFEGSLKTVVIDPGHGQIKRNGVPTFQRPASPTFGVIEDVLTLDMANSVKAELEGADIIVHLTRQTSLAPFAPPNCPVKCLADLNARARWAEKQEPDLLLSIHTNAADDPKAHGAESFFSTMAPAPDSKTLAQFVLTRVVDLGLRDRKVQQTNWNVINTSMPSSLVEVAFHSNSQLAKGQTVTDEERLADAAFRARAAKAMAEGIKDFYANKEN
jgi:N-acetylmuramoyl-L-alanine amidase